ncbi:MAG: MarR family transcriptional regulator [Clostridia bacterium]|nr:MarR family transcriptional regulator [Clostridia bacterium]
MNENYDSLRLKNQLCFPLYAVSNLVLRKYKPLLDKLDLTYTQYLVMMVLWEKEQASEKVLCESLDLQSNTLTPLIKKLADKGYIEKSKDPTDGRALAIRLTPLGKALQDKALCVPECMAKEFRITPEEANTLYRILYKILETEKERES